MEKCRELQRELGRLPLSKAEEKNNSLSSPPISSSNSSGKGPRNSKKQSPLTNSGRKSVKKL
ncbi:unnamed protein product, partial [Hymenolepis diminuta]